MSTVYLHRLTVTVITTECSPDAIERVIDQALSAVGMRGDARTDPENRQLCPSVRIADPPAFPSGHDKRAEQAWADQHDAWLDSWPGVEAFNA